MPWKMQLSWVVLGAGGLLGINVAESEPAFGSPLGAALLFSYIFWSLYWGAPAAWRWWRRGQGAHILQSLGSQFPEGLIRSAFTFSLLLTGCYFYCVFGGGIYKFVQYRRATRHIP